MTPIILFICLVVSLGYFIDMKLGEDETLDEEYIDNLQRMIENEHI